MILWLLLQIIPEDRTADWSKTGVPAYPARTRVVEVKGDLQAAVDAAKPDDVLLLPAGVFGGVRLKDRITLRGAGPSKTILKGTVSIGYGGADWWYPNRLKVDVLGKRGASTLRCDSKPLKVGMVVQIARRNNLELPVITPGGFDYLQRQVTRITALGEGTVTVSPAPLFDLPAGSKLAPAGRVAEFVGVEDLGVEDAGQVGVNITGAYGCWLKNVSVRNINNYHVSISDSLFCDIRRCFISTRKGSGSNGAGILMGTSSFCRIEDNVIAEQFPHIEVNASCGNVFAYNYCRDSDIQGAVGCSINSNHGGHSCFNLYEGNVSPKFQADGYHGSSSHDTVYRNKLHGTSPKTTQFWICVNLNRFTRAYSVVGNVLGAPGHPWLYDNAERGYGYDQHLIFSFGMPNMGNGGFSGKQTRNSWKDWGGSPGPGGFQELDLDVRATTILKANWNYKDKTVPPHERVESLPKSMYLKAKPAWWNESPWPPFGPDTTFERNKIPAETRY